MKKKFMAALLVAVMLMSTFAGCTSKPKDDTATPSTETKTEEKKEEKKDDAKPTTVTMTMWGDFNESSIETILVKNFNESRKDIQAGRYRTTYPIH